MSPVDVGTIIDESSWSARQKFFILLAALAVMFDGFDIQILGFAIPSIMREWHVARSVFAPVLAIGLVGLAAGSPIAGYFGDRFGRRTALIACLLLFAAATMATAFCKDVTMLGILRVLTGIGAGGALPNASAFSAELTPFHRRPIAVTLTIVCVPLGGMLGGLAATRILPAYGWRALYALGGGAPLVFALLLWVALPESPRFLVHHPNRWTELERLLARLGHPVPPGCRFEDRLERKPSGKASVVEIFGPEFRRDSFGLWLSYFANSNAVYLIFSWLPAMLTARGLDLAASSSGLAWWNFGGVLGVLVWTWLVTAFGSRAPLLIAAFSGAIVGCALQFVHSPHMLIAGLGLHGVFVNAVQTTLFAVGAHIYPTGIRASGVAYAAGIGRVGGILTSFTGVAILQSGSATYFRVLTLALLLAFVGIAIVQKHFAPAGQRLTESP